jgi:hypothetical protein
MKYLLIFEILLSLLNNYIFAIELIYYPRPAEYNTTKEYNYFLRARNINSTIIMTKEFSSDITFKSLYKAYAYSGDCSFGLIDVEQVNDKITKVFLVTGGHCLTDSDKYSSIIYPKLRSSFNACYLFHKSLEIDIGIVACESPLESEYIKPIKPAILKEDSELLVNSNKTISYVTAFRKLVFPNDIIWPDNWDCTNGYYMKDCVDIIEKFQNEAYKIVELKYPVIQYNSSDTYCYSYIGAFYGSAGSLGAFDDNGEFDLILVGTIKGTTNNKTAFVATQSKEFKKFYYEFLMILGDKRKKKDEL